MPAADKQEFSKCVDSYALTDVFHVAFSFYQPFLQWTFSQSYTLLSSLSSSQMLEQRKRCGIYNLKEIMVIAPIDYYFK